MLIDFVVEEVQMGFVEKEILQTSSIGSTMLFVMATQPMITTDIHRCRKRTKFRSKTGWYDSTGIMIIDFHRDTTTKSKEQDVDHFFCSFNERTFPIQCDAIDHHRHELWRLRRFRWRFDRSSRWIGRSRWPRSVRDIARKHSLYHRCKRLTRRNSLFVPPIWNSFDLNSMAHRDKPDWVAHLSQQTDPWFDLQTIGCGTYNYSNRFVDRSHSMYMGWADKDGHDSRWCCRARWHLAECHSTDDRWGSPETNHDQWSFGQHGDEGVNYLLDGTAKSFEDNWIR